MKSGEAERLYRKALEIFTSGDTLSALVLFEKAYLISNSPSYSSYMAFCIARERGQFQKAVSLCEEAITQEPENSVHYLNLGRIYLLKENKETAITVFREGLRHEKNRQIISELDRLEARKSPVLPFLRRENLLNKYIGAVLHRLGMR